MAGGVRDIKLRTLRVEVSGDLAYEIGEWRFAAQRASSCSCFAVAQMANGGLWLI